MSSTSQEKKDDNHASTTQPRNKNKRRRPKPSHNQPNSSNGQKKKHNSAFHRRNKRLQKDDQKRVVDKREGTKRRKFEVFPILELATDVQIEILTFLSIRYRMDCVRQCSKYFYALVESSVQCVGHDVGFNQKATEDYVYMRLDQISNLLRHEWIKEHVVSLHLSNMLDRSVKKLDSKRILSLASGNIPFSQFKQLKHFVMTETFNLIDVDVLCDELPRLEYFQVPRLFSELSRDKIVPNNSVKALVLTAQSIDIHLVDYIRHKLSNLEYLELESGSNQNIEEASITLFSTQYSSPPIPRITLNSRIVQSTSWLTQFCQNGASCLVELNLKNIGHSDMDDIRPLLLLAQTGQLKCVSFGECSELDDYEIERFLVLGCSVNIHLVCFEYGAGGQCPCSGRMMDDIYYALNLRHESENKSLKQVAKLRSKYPDLFFVSNEKSLGNPVHNKMKDIMSRVTGHSWNHILCTQ